MIVLILIFGVLAITLALVVNVISDLGSARPALWLNLN